MSKLTEAMSKAMNERREDWEECVRRSEQYRKALGLSTGELGTLLLLQGNKEVLGLLQVATTKGNMTLRAHHVCGVPYGGDWRTVLLPVAPGCVGLNVGGGTSHFWLLYDDAHEELLRAMRAS